MNCFGRMKNMSSLGALFLLVFPFLLTPSAMAEPAKGGADAGLAQSLRKAQGMLRQLSQEKADLEAKVQGLDEQVKKLEPLNAQLQVKLKEAQAALEAEDKTVKTLQMEKAALEKNKVTLSGQITQLKEGIATQREHIEQQNEQLRSAAEQIDATNAELEKNREDNQLMVNAVKERTRWIEDCSNKNRSLVKFQGELIKKYDSDGLWDKVKNAEPLTGIGRVSRENAVQDFQYKLQDLIVTPWKEPASATGATGQIAPQP